MGKKTLDVITVLTGLGAAFLALVTFIAIMDVVNGAGGWGPVFGYGVPALVLGFISVLCQSAARGADEEA